MIMKIDKLSFSLTFIAALVAVTLLCLMANNANAQNHRSSTEIAHFKRYNPCPANNAKKGKCPGWVIDHYIALDVGGPDDYVTNMIWQEASVSKLKDRYERRPNWQQWQAKYPPCPAKPSLTARCPGYAMTWRKPLECGGAKAIYNFTWQTPAQIQYNTKRDCAGELR